MTLLPRTLDNTYRGQKLALWIFGFVVSLKMLQSVMIIFRGRYTIIGADGIPLDDYPADAAQNIIAIFALGSLSRAIIMILCLIVLVRYRAAISAMFIVLALNFAAAELLDYLHPLARVGTPPGVIVNWGIFGLMLVGLALSLIPRKARA